MYTWVLGIFSALLVLLPVAVECCLYLQLTLAEAFCPSYSSRNSQKNNEIYQTQYPTWYWYRILGPKQSCAHNTVFLPPFSQPHTVLYGALWDLLPFLQLLKPFVSLAWRVWGAGSTKALWARRICCSPWRDRYIQSLLSSCLADCSVIFSLLQVQHLIQVMKGALFLPHVILESLSEL